jgi:hypothetical protein
MISSTSEPARERVAVLFELLFAFAFTGFRVLNEADVVSVGLASGSASPLLIMWWWWWLLPIIEKK